MSNPYVPAPVPFAIWGQGCILERQAALTVLNMTPTPLPWDTDVNDPYDFHSIVLNPERLTVPAGYAGRYHITAAIGWEDTTPSGAPGVVLAEFVSRSAALFLNGVPVVNTGSKMVGVGDFMTTNVDAVIDLVVGDYITLQVYNSALSLAGVALELTPYPRISMVCIGV